MNLIQGITSDSLQQQTLILPNGNPFVLQMKFVPMQYAWEITILAYLTFTLNGYRIVNSPNLLHQYRNQIPFGLGCFSTSNREPSQQQDFSSGASSLYVLTSQEVVEYQNFLVSGANT